MAAAKTKAAAKKPAKKKAAAKKRGRPSAFKPEFVKIAFKFALLGKTDKEIADLLGVSEQTLNTWKKKYPEFLESLKNGKDRADAEVAASLFQKSTGFYKSEERVVVIAGKATVLEVKRYYPPDTFAQTVWLNNRQPKFWRKNKEPDAGGNAGSGKTPFTFNVSEPSNPDLARPPEELGEDHKGGRVDTDYSDDRGK